MFTGKLEKVGVIGLGIIGSRVAENLRKAGKHVYVWSRSPKPEPNFLGSPGEVAENSETVQIFVSNGEALLEVIESMESMLDRRHIIINHSTVDLEATKKAEHITRAAGAMFLDCPFTGSKVAAESNQLVFYVGGDAPILDRARPLLEIVSKEIIHVGDIGDATVIKIATNMVSAATVQVLAEALAVTESQAVDGNVLMQALNANACCSDLVRMKLPTMLQGNFDPHFSLKNMFKDAQLALSMANETKIDIPALSTTASLMFKSIQKGRGDEDYSVLAANYANE